MNNDITKVTPLHDLTWFIKWTACIFVLIAVACRSIDEIPKVYDVSFSLAGTVGWLWVGYLWHDRALIVLNAVLVFMLTISTLRYIVL